MSRERFLEILAVASIGLALYAAVDLFGSTAASRPSLQTSEVRQEARAGPQPEPEAQRPEPPPVAAAVAAPTSTVALAASTSSSAATTTLAIQTVAPAPVEPPAPVASAPTQAPGTYAEFENDEDRKDSLLEMQRQKMKSGMAGLNARAERLAAQAAAAARSGR